ncbi:unnamed protein product [Prorocentrum cordatum]|uniref:Uncharacterized protein n=1 Tax=Prorocentrum cordatum TaxID=2364126 RepID=A0ABN9PRR5_9DINO|nr:unnamed protein product [Polarella glacialis]
MASIEENLRLVASDVEQALSAATSDNPNPSQLVSKCENLLRTLGKHDLLYERIIPNDEVRVHSTNRDGVGLDPFDVHCLIERVLRQGWVSAKTVSSVCFEVDPRSDNQCTFNETLALSSDGMIAPVRKENLHFLSVAGSHTVGGLNAVAHSCATFLDEIATDGRLSIDKVRAVNADYADAVATGFKWRVIRWQVDERFPGLAAYIQEAMNSGHDTERVATKIQVLLELHRKGKANVSQHGDFRWQNIATSVEASKQHMRGQIMDMTAFVERWSGGASGDFLASLNEWAKTLRSRAEVPGSMFKMLSSLELDSMPEVVYSLLKAAMRSPPKYCHAGTTTSKLLNSTDVGTLIKDKRRELIDLAAKARASNIWYTEDLLKAGVHVSRATFVKLQGVMEVDAIMFLMKKAVPNRAAHASLDQIAGEFMDALYLAHPALKDVQPPWNPPEKKSSPNSSKKGQSGFRELSTGGLNMGVVTSLGYKQGLMVELKKKPEDVGGPQQWQISKIDAVNDMVMLKTVRDGEVSKLMEDVVEIDCGKLVDLYKVVVEQEVERFESKGAALSETLGASVLRASLIAKEAMFSAYASNSQAVDVDILFSRGAGAKVNVQKVVVNKKYDKGSLVLVALSNTCSVALTARVPAGAVHFFRFDGIPVGHSAFVVPTQVWPAKAGASKKQSFVAPFWEVPSTDARGDANMIDGVVKVEVHRECKPGSGSSKIVVAVPCLVNSKAVAKDSALLRLKADHQAVNAKRAADEPQDSPKVPKDTKKAKR